MAQKPGPTSEIGGWLDKFSALSGDVDTGLDQVKKSIQGDLDELRKSRKLTDLAVNFYASAEEGFKKDLNEIGVTGEAQLEYLALFRAQWETASMKSKSREILSSPELAGMDAFITQMENLPKVKAVIESAEPQSGWVAMISGAAAKYLGINVNDPKYKDFFKSAGQWLASALGIGGLLKLGKGKKKKPSEGKKADQAEVAAAAKQEAEAPAETSEALAENPSEGLYLGVLGLKRWPLGQETAASKGGKSIQWGMDQFGLTEPLKESESVVARNQEMLKKTKEVYLAFGTSELLAGESAGTAYLRLQKLIKGLKNINPELKVKVSPLPESGLDKNTYTAAVVEGIKKLNEMINKGQGQSYSIINDQTANA